MSANTDKLAQQIRAIQAVYKIPLDGIGPAPKDWILNQIVAILDKAGTTDVLHIYDFTSLDAGMSFFGDYATGQIFPKPAQHPGVDYGSPVDYAAAVFAEVGDGDRWNYWIYCKLTPDYYPVFFAVSQDTGSDWVAIRTGIIFVGGTVVSFAFPALGATIGNAVLGAEIAATYPALAAAIGNLAIQTAMNGGDVRAALISTIAAGGGQIAGVAVVSATGAQWLGSAAAAATSAVIGGGDPLRAVAVSLANSGINNAGDLFSSPAPAEPAVMSDPFSDISFSGSTDSSPALDLSGGNNLFPVDSSNPGNYTFDTSAPPLPSAMQMTGSDTGLYDYTFSGQTSPGYNSPTDSAPASSLPLPNTNAAAGASGTNYAALITAGLQLVKAFTGAGSPNVVQYSANQQGNANGTVTVRNANGTVSTIRPTVGVPYQTANGSVITNNGDGTFTTTQPNGSSVKTTYAAAGLSALGSTPVLLGIAAVAAFVLMK